MDINNAISPLDGQYRSKISDVIKIFNNKNFTKTKINIECRYLILFINILSKMQVIPELDIKVVANMYKFFVDNIDNEIQKIELYEKETNNDIQALIMYIKTNLPDNYKEHVHFGLTSQDINNPAMVMMHREFNLNILKSDIDKLKFTLLGFVKDYSNVRMVTFTHGQPSTPTSFGKQMNVFAYKISNIIDDLYEDYQYKTKMGGSNGDFTALKLAYPSVDWVSIITNFINNSLKLERNPHTTQIDNYSNYFKLFQIYERLCCIIINICQDMWMYCSKNYLKLKNIEGGGSSAIAHKINPIHFENAEGNLKIAGDLFHSIGRNIMSSCLQRDLTDSTILRNVGSACGYMVIGLRNCLNGLESFSLNVNVIDEDLMNNNIVLMEFIQLIMRKYNIPDAYNICKSFSRGKKSFTLTQFLSHLNNNKVKYLGFEQEIKNAYEMNI
jgi:adenylosuccinate lyase